MCIRDSYVSDDMAYNFNLGYPGLEKEEVGSPGYPEGTQWIGKNIIAQRLRKGRHLLYRDTTTGGMSGSPLFYMDEIKKKAFVVGAHVGGSKILANTAVPISQHMKTIETWIEETSSPGKTTF